MCIYVRKPIMSIQWSRFRYSTQMLVLQFSVIPSLLFIIGQPLTLRTSSGPHLKSFTKFIRFYWSSSVFFGNMYGRFSLTICRSSSACLGTRPVIFHLLTRIVPYTFMVSFTSLNILPIVRRSFRPTRVILLRLSELSRTICSDLFNV